MCRTPTRRPHSPAHRCRVGTPARRTPGSRACFHPIQGRPAPARPRLAGTLPLQAWRGWSGPGQAERTDRRTGKALGARTARAVPRLRTARVSPCSLLTAGREAGQDQLPRRGCGRIIRDGGSNRRTALVLGEEFQALTFCPGGAVLRPGNHAGRELRSRAGQAVPLAPPRRRRLPVAARRNMSASVTRTTVVRPPPAWQRSLPLLKGSFLWSPA